MSLPRVVTRLDMLSLSHLLDHVHPHVEHSRTPSLPPILRLPTKLLLDILQRSVNSRLRRDKDPLRILAKHHWLALSTVCSKWHDVILGTHMIWADMDIWWLDPRHETSAVELIQRSLLRAGTSPLRLTVDVTHTYRQSRWFAIRRRWVDSNHLEYTYSTQSMCNGKSGGCGHQRRQLMTEKRNDLPSTCAYSEYSRLGSLPNSLSLRESRQQSLAQYP
ncbi:F-box domain-containing protein [Mycena indigotica]|uniref:F-box domain-containing protein n=1 Tax=Mycena indigotica TaxID=2126181 RepID=A0A8H6S8F8_9AGAR|nr:F-box domain-containing protein [Mycena indigotica]KAF7293712.1 F-box domain-containing protein [Mycena indigotica]